MKHFIFPFLMACTFSSAASANEFEAAMKAFVDKNVASWVSDPLLVNAARTQNTQTAGYDDATITELDNAWKAHAGQSCGAILLDVLGNPAASMMRDRVDATDGAITEALLMDARGLNVAATRETSDYWQGDEAKYTETFLAGPGAVHYGEIGLDESTQQVQGQVSMTIVDSETGEAVGALTIGINLTALM